MVFMAILGYNSNMSLKHINASNGSGEAVRATITAIRAPLSTTLNVDAVTNWPSYFIATAGTLQSDGTLANALVFFGHLSGSQIIIDTIAPGYVDSLGNSVGQVVLIKPNTPWANNVATVLGTSLADDGTFSSSGATDMAAKLSGKQIRLKPRISVTTTTGTLTPNIDNYSVYELNAQATSLSLAAPTGTPNDGDAMIIRIKDNGTTRAITYDAVYANISGLDTLATTTVSKWHVLGIMYNAGVSKWQILSITTEA